MDREIINKIKLLNSNLSGLVIGKINENFNEFYLECFKNYECLEFTSSSIEKINQVLFKRFDIVILLLNKEDYILFKNYNFILPEYTIFIIDDEIYDDFRVKINKINFLLVNPIKIEYLAEKIFKIILMTEGEKLLRDKRVISKQKDLRFLSTDFNLFLEQHCGEMMFLNDEFSEYLVSLKNLEISKSLFFNISSSLIKLSNVLKEREELKELSKILLDFSNFIVNLDFKTIDSSCYEKFDYFTLIIEDIIMYIDELFVRRLFNNVKVFSDSLANNLQYFKEQLYNKNSSINSSLEFFDD